MIDDRSYRIETRFDHAAGDEGVLWAVGDLIGGVVMYVESGIVRRGPVLWTLYEEHGAFRFTGHIEQVRVTPGARAGTIGA